LSEATVPLAPGGFPLGVVPSPADPRDYAYHVYCRVLSETELPETYTAPGIVDVDNQGAVNSCVAHSLGLIKDWQEAKECPPLEKHSRQFIYAYRPNEYYYKGPGMIPREALATLADVGVVKEAVWPGITEWGQEVWPGSAESIVVLARPYKVASYVSIDYRQILAMKSALFTTGPILYCIPVYANFTPDANGIIPMPAGTLLGYHATAAIGWKPGYWLVQNSWGEGWGQGGRCWIPWNFPALEVWGITDATTERTMILKLTIGSTLAYLDGRPITLLVAPYISNGRTMLGVRDIGEAFGAVMDWGPKTGTTQWVTATFKVPM